MEYIARYMYDGTYGLELFIMSKVCQIGHDIVYLCISLKYFCRLIINIVWCGMSEICLKLKVFVQIDFCFTS